MEEKKCPVDRGRRMVTLECCRLAKCWACPYSRDELDVCQVVLMDALEYILYLEEQLGVSG